MTVRSRRCASRVAIADFPEAVGPQITGIVALPRASPSSASPEAALELIPGQLYDCLTTMHVVRGQPAAVQRDEQRAHLRG